MLTACGGGVTADLGETAPVAAGGVGGVGSSGVAGSSLGGAAGAGQVGGQSGAAGQPAAGFAGAAMCMPESGVRLCHAACGTCCGTPDCFDFCIGPSKDGALGVCLTEAIGARGERCSACLEGDVCIGDAQGPAPALICGPESVCKANLMSGTATNHCFYSDKTPYTGGEIPNPATCPPASGGLALCGGACGACTTGFTCTGRSPTHPVGLCIPVKDGLPGPFAKDCGTGQSCLNPGQSCFLHGSSDLQKEYGFCLSNEACGAAAAILGGLCVSG